MSRRLGWDITDFGLANFDQYGLTLFTIRNGEPTNVTRGDGVVYAEKVLVVEVAQVTPVHYHWQKTEDIINRGGGRLAIRLYNATEDDQLADSEVTVLVNSIPRRVPAGGVLMLEPGESVTLTPRLFHGFWAEGESVLVGEVSSVNDDLSDNYFYDALGRFPRIEEDAPPYRLLVGDYAHIL